MNCNSAIATLGLALFLPTGCGSARRTSAPQEEPELRGRAIIEAFIRASRAPQDDQHVPTIRAVGWGLAGAAGYDFKGNTEGWEYWYGWLTRRDLRIIPTCLASGATKVQDLGVDMALTSGSREAIRAVLTKYCEGDEWYQGSVELGIWAWMQGGEFTFPGGPAAGQKVKLVLRGTPQFWHNVVSWCGWAEPFLREHGYLKPAQ